MSSFPAQLSVVFLGTTVLVAPFAVMAEDVPDALSVEWQGQKPCEKLFEDDQVRISRCSFPPPNVSTISGKRRVKSTNTRRGCTFGYFCSTAVVSFMKFSLGNG